MSSPNLTPLSVILPLLLTATLSFPFASSSPSQPINPFSPLASLLRHWKRLFPSTEMPSILLSKSSPLNTTQLATFSSYIDSHTLSHHLRSFCSAANLFCDLKVPAHVTHDLHTDADFESYTNNMFKRYQADAFSGSDSFKNYSIDGNVARDNFARYAKGGNAGSAGFLNYELNTNVAASSFNTYGGNSNGELANFDSYSDRGNVQRQDFTSYGRDSSAILQFFSSYSENSNVARNGFRNYAKDANAALSQFSGYSTSSNVISNKFSKYDDGGNGGSHRFDNYADSVNVGSNQFKSYSKNGNAGSEHFTSYGNQGSQPKTTFKSYGEGTNALQTSFTNYNNSSFPTNSTTEFVEYNKDASGEPNVQFIAYSGGVNPTFKEYFRSSTDFTRYFNDSSLPDSTHRGVEPGKFFRQSSLMVGNHIPFPDIRDKMPKRSFLPKYLADKFPFNSNKLPELVQVLQAQSMKGMMARTISECERSAAKGETKRCVTSAEAMAEFAASMIGPSGRVSATESNAGWGENLVVGKVSPRNGGKETRSVSCHQNLFPYLTYYCHMVPRVKVYDVELRRTLDGGKLNLAVAICHLDTTQWSAKHEAFLALGPAPGKIEVCHFIFENDLIWVAGSY